MKKINIIKNLSPLNDFDEMATSIYITKKLLAFFMIYCLAAVAGEGIITGILYVMGYHPLHRIMPTGKIGVLLPYYGFFVFLLVTVLYCRFIEKQDLHSLGFTKKITDYWFGGIIAIILLAVILGLCCITDVMLYSGIKGDINGIYLIALFIGLLIQSVAEETLCRGFLLKSLLRKTSVSVAILVSSTSFAIPHFLTLFESELKYAITGIINLYLISAIFSLLVLYRSNIWISCGLHSIWNFILYGILGLTLSGNCIK